MNSVALVGQKITEARLNAAPPPEKGPEFADDEFLPDQMAEAEGRQQRRLVQMWPADGGKLAGGQPRRCHEDADGFERERRNFVLQSAFHAFS
jgi:hypothetical protein